MRIRCVDNGDEPNQRDNNMANFKPSLQVYKHLLLTLTAAALLWAALPTQTMAAKTDRYVVQKGDTLWDISKRFLNNPWLWPEVWHINPKICNPHLIYPGDVVLLFYVDGKPYLTLEGNGGLPIAPVAKNGLRTVRMSPKSHALPLEKAISTLPYDLIAPFLKYASVIPDDDILEEAPYVVSSFEEHLVSGSGGKIYVRNMTDKSSGNYTVVRPGATYRDPQTDDILGYEVLHIADARVVKLGEPASLVLGKATQEVLNEDRLLPYEGKKPDFYFFPSAPSKTINGQIISVIGGVSLIGQYSVVVLNRGEREGMVPGHVLAVYQDGTYVRDPIDRSPVKLPQERAGIMMIFRTFEKVSYALVLEAERSMSINDSFTNP